MLRALVAAAARRPRAAAQGAGAALSALGGDATAGLGGGLCPGAAIARQLCTAGAGDIADPPGRVINLVEQRKARAAANASGDRSISRAELSAEIAAAKSAAGLLNVMVRRLGKPPYAHVDSEILTEALKRVMELARREDAAHWLRGDSRFKHLCEAHAPHLQSIHSKLLVEVLLDCGKARVVPSNKWMYKLWSVSALRLRAFDGASMSTLLHALSLLEHKPGERWLSAFWAASGEKLQVCAPYDLSSLIASCAVLNLVPPDDWQARFWLASEHALPTLRGPGLPIMLHACGKLKIGPPPSWLQQYWAASEASLGEFTSRGLTSSFRACGVLGVTPSPTWMDAFWKAAERRLPSFVDKDWASLLDACASLGFAPPAAVVTHFMRVISGDTAIGFSGPSFAFTMHACSKLGITPAEGWEGHIEALPPKMALMPLLYLLKACNSLGVKPSDEWWRRYWAANSGPVHELDKGVLAQTAEAYQTLTGGDWLAQFWSANAPSLAGYSHTDLLSTLEACIHLDITPPETWLQTFYRVSGPSLLLHDAKGLLSILSLMSKLTDASGLVLPEPFLKQYWVALNAKLRDLKPFMMNDALVACSRAAITPPSSFLVAFMERCAPELKKDQTMLSHFLVLLAALKLWELPLLPKLFDALESSFAADAATWDAATHSHAHDWYAFYRAVSVERPGLVAAPRAAVLEAARASWRAAQTARLAAKAQTREELGASLARLGIKHEAAQWCERSEQYADVAVPYTGEPVAILISSVRDPSGDQRLPARMQLRMRMLAAHGWRPVTVNAGRWDALQTPELKDELMRSMLS